MARVKGALNTRKRHKKILKLAKGFRGAESKQFRIANQAVMRSMQNAYVGRKRRKRDFRRLWITRISAACKQNGMNYSTFMNGLKKSGIEMNRKMLSEIAIADSVAFAKLVETAKAVFNLEYIVTDFQSVTFFMQKMKNNSKLILFLSKEMCIIYS